MIGDVSINGSPAGINQSLENKDIIVTGPESSAELTLGTAGGIQIRENSRIEVVFSDNGWDVLSLT
jgi:hypothetical protein